MRGVFAALGWMLGGGVAVALVALISLGVVSLPPQSPSAAGDRTAEAAAPQRTCPPIVAVPPRAEGAPLDEVEGVRRGFTVAEAQEALLCADEAYRFRFEPVWHTVNAPLAPRQLMYAERPGGADVVAGLVGLSGRETVAMLWRRETYALQGAPRVADLEAALVARHGPPHAVEQTRLRRILTWAYDPAGAAMPQAPQGFMQAIMRQGPTRERCAETLKDTPFSAPTPNPQCGLTIRATIEGRLEQADRASSLRLVLADQAGLAADLAANRAALRASR